MPRRLTVCLAAAQTALQAVDFQLHLSALQLSMPGRGCSGARCPVIAAQLSAPLDCILCQLVSVTQLAGIL